MRRYILQNLFISFSLFTNALKESDIGKDDNKTIRMLWDFNDKLSIRKKICIYLFLFLEALIEDEADFGKIIYTLFKHDQLFPFYEMHKIGSLDLSSYQGLDYPA